MGLVSDCKITQNRADTQVKAPPIARRGFGVGSFNILTRER